jgi:hypothetical protein
MYDHLRPTILFIIERYDLLYKVYILSSPVDVVILSLHLKVQIKRTIKKGVNTNTTKIVCTRNFKMCFILISF